MSEGLSITTEQVDDYPVLVAQMRQMDIPELLDQHCADQAMSRQVSK